jgi:flagellar basal body-associated protein FliL
MPDEKSPKPSETAKEKTKKPENAEQQPAEKPVKSRARTRFIVIVVAIALLQAVVAFFLVQKFFLSKAGTEEKSSSQATETLGEMLPLEDVIVNPAGGEGKRFLVVSMTLVLDASTPAKDVEKKLPELKDKILEFLSAQSVAQLAEVKFRKKLRQDLMQLINDTIAPGRVVRLYFTKFILQ